jgi:hypothetical protein
MGKPHGAKPRLVHMVHSSVVTVTAEQAAEECTPNKDRYGDQKAPWFGNAGEN